MNLNQKTTQAAAHAILFLSTFMTGTLPAAIAQSTAATNSAAQPGATLQTARPLKRFTGAQNYMYSTEALKSPVPAANLPSYQGASKFTGGLNYSRLKTGQCFIMRFVSKEYPHQVMKSYRNTLQQYGWQINEGQTNSKQLTAVIAKEGLYVTFCVFPTYKDGYNTSFEIKYLAIGKVRTETL